MTISVRLLRKEMPNVSRETFGKIIMSVTF